ncbi:MAG: hypothetical protein HYX27_13515 [Acidobacteria bacterium]|nr:hypothetical protein [Acidobacteriota bacterium]
MLKLIFQIATLSLLSAMAISAQISLYSSQRGRTYTVTTTAKQYTFSSNFGKRWLYQPAVIKPAPETGYQWVLLFVTCNQEHPDCVVTDQGLYMATSSDGLNFGTPTKLLNNPTGVSDFIAPRAVYVNVPNEGYRWFVYVQGVYASAPTKNNVFGAKGTSLTSLAWVYSGGVAYPFVNSAAGSSAGIGEDFQVYNVTNYDALSGYGVLALYNDWNSPYGGQMFAAVGDGNSFNYWYGPGGETYASGTLVKFGDVLLGGSLDASTKGSPSLTFHETCTGNNVPGYGIGINPDPYPYGSGTGYRSPIPATGIIQSGTVNVISTSMFRPRMARNSQGFLDPDNPSSNPRTWTTYVYYTPGAINTGSNCSDNYHQVWKSTSQNFGVSEVVITEN